MEFQFQGREVDFKRFLTKTDAQILCSAGIDGLQCFSDQISCPRVCLIASVRQYLVSLLTSFHTFAQALISQPLTWMQDIFSSRCLFLPLSMSLPVSVSSCFLSQSLFVTLLPPFPPPLTHLTTPVSERHFLSATPVRQHSGVDDGGVEYVRNAAAAGVGGVAAQRRARRGGGDDRPRHPHRAGT